MVYNTLRVYRKKKKEEIPQGLASPRKGFMEQKVS